MRIPLLSRLEQASADFAARRGDLCLLIQSKSDPQIKVGLNADQPVPSASLIKLAIACTAAQAAKDGDLDLSAPRLAGSLDSTFYCSILQAFEASHPLSLKALIGLMLIVSDNPSTTAVLDAVGMDRVNAWLRARGLNATGLEIGFADDALGAPLRANLTTASDCLQLLQLIDTEVTFAFIKKMLANNLRNERIPKLLPDAAIIAHKTGTLNGLVHDIALIESPDAAYFLIVLADRLEDESGFTRDLTHFSRQVYDLMSA